MSDLTRVKLTEEEWQERAKALAERVRDLAHLLDEQKEQRADDAKERRELEREVRRLSDCVRTGVEDREKQIGMFPR